MQSPKPVQHNYITTLLLQSTHRCTPDQQSILTFVKKNIGESPNEQRDREREKQDKKTWELTERKQERVKQKIGLSTNQTTLSTRLTQKTPHSSSQSHKTKKQTPPSLEKESVVKKLHLEPEIMSGKEGAINPKEEERKKERRRKYDRTGKA